VSRVGPGLRAKIVRFGTIELNCSGQRCCYVLHLEGEFIGFKNLLSSMLSLMLFLTYLFSVSCGSIDLCLKAGEG